MPSQVLTPDFLTQVGNDLSHAYARVFLVALILIAATTIPALFLTKRPTPRTDSTN